MATYQRILSVDLGSSSIKLGEFRVDRNGALTLLNYGIKDLGIDPNKDQERFTHLLEGLRTLMVETGIKPGPAVLGVSGQSVFTRFIKLPPSPPEQIEQMVGFEAQQNVPFPIEEMVWDYQLLSGANGEIEAIIVAIKTEIVEEAAAALNAVNISVAHVDVIPLALANAFHYIYAHEQVSSLIMDVGAKTTNLIFVEGQKVFNRTVPIAGNLISQNICNEFQEPFTAAELLKKGKGFVGLGGAYADPEDEASARISKIARAVYSRLHAEVGRSVNFFRNQQGGSPPEVLLLTGGSSSLPYSDVFFREKLSVRVEYFNPFNNLAITPQIDRQRLVDDAGFLAPLVGMALRTLGNCPIEVDLTPPSVKEKKANAGRAATFVLAMVVLAVALALPAAAYYLLDQEVAGLLEKRQKDYRRINSLKGEIQDEQKKYETLAKELESLQRLDAQRQFWPSLLDQVSKRVPVGIWITSLEVTQANDKSLKDYAPPKQNPRDRRKRGRDQKEEVQEALNLVPKAEKLHIEGIVEVNRSNKDTLDRFHQLTEQASQEVERFRSSLEEIAFFTKVTIKERQLPRPGSTEELGLTYHIEAELDPNLTPDTKP